MYYNAGGVFTKGEKNKIEDGESRMENEKKIRRIGN